MSVRTQILRRPLVLPRWWLATQRRPRAGGPL